MPTISNGRIAGGNIGDVHYDSGLIVEEPADDELIDASDLIVAPGFIDIQINGGLGHDFTQDPTTIWSVGERLPELGVTSFVPTVVTSPPDVTDLALDVVANRRPADYRGADVVGLHFEGPWISPDMHGAHNPGHIARPDVETARRWGETGLVRIVTIAPELPAAADVIRALRSAGTTVSVGHTTANFDTTRRAYREGATLATHLFNQMGSLDHRDPGAAAAAMLDADGCLLILDGLHLADGIVELAWRILGPHRTILATDAMAALGLGPGTYPLGDGPITVGEDGPRTVDGRLAGSVATLAEALSNLIEITGATISDALPSVTVNPARAIHLGDRGVLAPGSRADLTLFDEDFHVVRTVVAGESFSSE